MASFMIIVTAAFVVIAYVGYVMVDFLWLRKARIRRQLHKIAEQSQPLQPKEAQAPGESFPTISHLLSSQGFADRLFLFLMRAGVKLRPSEFIGIVAGLTVALVLVAALAMRNIQGQLIAAIIGVSAPFIYVKGLQARRLAMFNRQLPDALSLISSAIRSGYSFARAVQMVADEMPAPISEEFQRVLNETNVGLATDAALKRMSARVGSYDLELVVVAVIIQQQIGGNLAEIIDNIAGTIRDRVRVEGEISALTADGRISGIVLVLLPFAMAGIILMLNPGYLAPLISEPRGLTMIIGGLCLQALGALIIKRMLAVDY